jgi:2-(1,2-epoxy-1,2-dihydrophenyl)acetyl-CoA isomerase
MNSLIEFQEDETCYTLTLNRPERHNSLVPELLEALIERLDFVAESVQNLPVILNAKGRSFSTGGDILGFYQNREDLVNYSTKLVGLLNETMLRMLKLQVPIIAAVHGIVTGGSIGLILAADILLLTPTASFTPYYGKLGFSPDGGWTAILPAIIGTKRVSEILLYNKTIQAVDALNWGLCTRIVPDDVIQQEARKIAQEITKQEQGSTRATKVLLNASIEEFESKLQKERDLFITQIQTKEAMQGIASFLKL